MANKFGVLISYAITFQLLFHACISKPLEITVYYESLCPDCQNFFINQFEPNFEKFINYVNWNLIPYGNARTVRYPNGTIKSITCQHGELECYGNSIQACVLRNVPDSIREVRFCLCFMVNKGNDAALAQCGQTYKIDYNKIKTCAKSREGLEILADYGNIQRETYPPIEAVPTLALNGKQLTQTENEEFFANCCQFICTRLTAGKPDACNSCSPKKNISGDLSVKS